MTFSKLASFACLGLAAPICFAQGPALFSTTAAVASGSDTAGSSTASPAVVVASSRPAPTDSPWQGKVNRWVDVDELSFGFRYRNEMETDGFRAFDNGQQKSLVVADVKLDPQAKYVVHLRVSSGRTFNWAYTDEIGEDFQKRGTSAAAAAALSPLQLAGLYAAFGADSAGLEQSDHIYSRGWAMGFRELYFRAAPIKQVAVEFGSLGIEKGISTEATTYDDDGYITGERVRLFDSKHLFFDQVAATFAYEGDITAPSFFDRGQRLGQENYRQVFVAKKVDSRLETSADYTFDKGTHTLHEAAAVKAPEVKAIDSVRLELYQRLNNYTLSGAVYYARQGFAVTASKAFYKKFELEAGAAHIDYDYGVLTGVRLLAFVGNSMNGDSYLTGTRAFTRANYKAANGVTFYGYFSHIITDAPPANLLLNKQGVSGGMTVDFKSLFTKAHAL